MMVYSEGMETKREERTMSDDTYEGWSNYPTWAVNLWLSNDEPLYREALESVRLVHERITEGDDYMTRDQIVRFEVAEGFKRWVEDMAPDLGASFSADLLGYAVGCVDWYELADAWIESHREAVEYETSNH
jgi:hypothetical protein